MNTEKTKNSLADIDSLNGDFPVPPPLLVFLCTTTLQNPPAPRGFYRGTDGPTRLLPIYPVPFPSPKFPCPTRPRSRTAASRPTRLASAVRVGGTLIGSFPLCVLSDLCGVPLRAPTTGAFPENTAEIGRNAERERAEARAPRGFLPERGCVRGAPAAAGWPQGTSLISAGASGNSGCCGWSSADTAALLGLRLRRTAFVASPGIFKIGAGE